MEKITLYTCENGFSLFKTREVFYASDIKYSDSYLEFTVNKEDVAFITKDGNANIYEIINFNSVEWVEK